MPINRRFKPKPKRLSNHRYGNRASPPFPWLDTSKPKSERRRLKNFHTQNPHFFPWPAGNLITTSNTSRGSQTFAIGIVNKVSDDLYKCWLIVDDDHLSETSFKYIGEFPDWHDALETLVINSDWRFSSKRNRYEWVDKKSRPIAVLNNRRLQRVK